MTVVADIRSGKFILEMKSGRHLASYPWWMAFRALDMLIEAYSHPIPMTWLHDSRWYHHGWAVFHIPGDPFSATSEPGGQILSQFNPSLEFVAEDGDVWRIRDVEVFNAILEFIRFIQPKDWKLREAWTPGFHACAMLAGRPTIIKEAFRKYSWRLYFEDRSSGGYLFFESAGYGARLTPVWQAVGEIKTSLFISIQEMHPGVRKAVLGGDA